MMTHNTAFAVAETRLFRTDADRPLALLRACPAYAPTPLSDIPALATACGVGAVHVKDETQRMRLGSFKALGGAFAVAQTVMDRTGTDDPTCDKAKAGAAAMTFITASAGNHGLSVAAGARIFGARAAIVLSAQVPEAFAARIRELGADVIRVPGTYEASVAEAMTLADARGWLLLADGSWDGYTDRPALVMEGYTVLAEECRAAFAESGDWPTHVFLQAGVGGLAAAVAAHIRVHWPVQPTITVVEPDVAPCLRNSIRAHRLTRVDGASSNMGRLDCKEASLIAFDALKDDADAFITVSDEDAADAAVLLDRHGLTTTPSGAAALAGVRAVSPNIDSRVLVIVTEGRETG